MVEVKYRCLRYPSPLPLYMLFMLASYLSCVLCKYNNCVISCNSDFLAIFMLPCNTGDFLPTSVAHRGSAVDVRGETMAYRDAPGHTVAPLGLHPECTLANRCMTGTDRDHFLPQTGAGPKHCREYMNASNSITNRPGVHRDSVNEPL